MTSESRPIIILLGATVVQLIGFAFVCRQQAVSTEVLVLWFALDIALLLAIFRMLKLERREAVLSRLVNSVDSTAEKRSLAESASVVSRFKKRFDQLRMRETLLFEYSQNVLLMLNAEGTVIAANKTIGKNWGIAHQNLLGEKFSQHIWQESMGEYDNLLQRTRLSREPGVALLRIRSPLRSHVFGRCSVEWSETKQAYYCSVVDYSAQWMIERIRAEYSGMVTHDLRTPLATLQLLLEGLQSEQLGALTDGGHARVSAAMSSLTHLSSLVSKLVTLDQSEAGELRLHKQMVPLDALICECVAITSAAAEQKGISIRQPPSEDVVWCDKEAITRVLTNLLANAIAYSGEGTVVDVFIESRMQVVQVSVADRGPGVADQDKQAVFERYRTSDRIKGLGLGLAVAKALTSAHGQEIGVLDRDGGGAIFYFTLQLATEEEIG